MRSAFCFVAATVLFAQSEAGLLFLDDIIDPDYCTATATFASDDVVGTVTLSGTSVHVDMTVIDTSVLPGGSACLPTTGETMFWYIESTWTDTTQDYGIGTTECSEANTGGIYDPETVCGPDSSNTDCAAVVNPGYDCNPLAYRLSSSGNVCMAGDLSGKYGGLSGKAWYPQSFDFYTLDRKATDPCDLTGRSIVIRCVDGSRAICGLLTVTE